MSMVYDDKTQGQALTEAQDAIAEALRLIRERRQTLEWGAEHISERALLKRLETILKPHSGCRDGIG